MDVAGWVTKILGVVWEGITAVRAFFTSPQVEIVPSESFFGRLHGGQFALLLKVRFRNESERPVLVRSLRVEYAGAWHEPENRAPAHLALHFAHGQYAIGTHPEEFIIKARRIPAVEEVERRALYLLSQSEENIPRDLPITVEAVFSRGKTRRVPVTLHGAS